MNQLVALEGANVGFDFFGGEGFANVLGLIDVGRGGEAAGFGVDESDDFHVRGAKGTRGMQGLQFGKGVPFRSRGRIW